MADPKPNQPISPDPNNPDPRGPGNPPVPASRIGRAWRALVRWLRKK